jgi:hypothetical protein
MLRKYATQRLHLWLCGLILPAVIVPALAEHSPSIPASNVLAIAILPQGPYAPEAVRAMANEVSQIMKRSGLKLEWHMDSMGRTFDEPLAVVKLLGTCGMDRRAAAGKPGPLGWTDVADGAMLPFSELACDRIRSSIASVLHIDDPVRGNQLLGRAMGRVLAHELFHIVAATQQHTGSGVSQAGLSPKDLIADRLELDPEAVELLQEHLHLH